MSTDPLLNFLNCQVNSLVRSNTVWNTMMMDKEFCKCTNGGFGRSISCIKGKSITRINIYSSKNSKADYPQNGSILST